MRCCALTAIRDKSGCMCPGAGSEKKLKTSDMCWSILDTSTQPVPLQLGSRVVCKHHKASIRRLYSAEKNIKETHQMYIIFFKNRLNMLLIQQNGIKMRSMENVICPKELK